MRLPQRSAQSAYRFLYTTNRVPDNFDGPIEDRFGTGRETSLECRTRISRGIPFCLPKTAFLAHSLDISTPVLLFDWPGNPGSLLRGFGTDLIISGVFG
jgi:hypothetical protein